MAKPEVKPTPPPQKDNRPAVDFVRAKRKGQGWIAEVLSVPQALIDSGAVTVRELGDWDIWPAVEAKVLNNCKPREF